MERVMEKQPRLKVTMMIPYRLVGVIDDVARVQLGVGRSAFFTMASVMLLAQMAAMLPAKRRATLLKELGEEFQMIAEKAAKAA